MKDFIKTVLYGIPVAIILSGVAILLAVYQEIAVSILGVAGIIALLYVIGMITKEILKERKKRRNE